jgi:hypothetical protein
MSFQACSRHGKDRTARLETAMLAMKPNCERCEAGLPPMSPDARICSYECTFCADCTDGPLSGACPNCGGQLLARPTRRPKG